MQKDVRPPLVLNELSQLFTHDDDKATAIELCTVLGAKGRGVVATRDIPAGTVVLTHRAVAVAHSKPAGNQETSNSELVQKVLEVLAEAVDPVRQIHLFPVVESSVGSQSFHRRPCKTRFFRCTHLWRRPWSFLPLVYGCRIHWKTARGCVQHCFGVQSLSALATCAAFRKSGLRESQLKRLYYIVFYNCHAVDAIATHGKAACITAHAHVAFPLIVSVVRQNVPEPGCLCSRARYDAIAMTAAY